MSKKDAIFLAARAAINEKSSYALHAHREGTESAWSRPERKRRPLSCIAWRMIRYTPLLAQLQPRNYAINPPCAYFSGRAISSMLSSRDASAPPQLGPGHWLTSTAMESWKEARMKKVARRFSYWNSSRHVATTWRRDQRVKLRFQARRFRPPRQHHHSHQNPGLPGPDPDPTTLELSNHPLTETQSLPRGS